MGSQERGIYCFLSRPQFFSVAKENGKDEHGNQVRLDIGGPPSSHPHFPGSFLISLGATHFLFLFDVSISNS